MTSAPTYPLSDYLHIAYDGYSSIQLSAQASSNEVRSAALESLTGIQMAKVERSYASPEVENVCIDLSVGSSTIQCSSSCSPCNFKSEGIVANQLIKIGPQWFRVSSTYDGIKESFTLASDFDSFASKQYIQGNTLTQGMLHIWTGGYKWTVSLLKLLETM